MRVQTMDKELGKFKAANRELADANSVLQAELREIQAVLAKNESEGTIMRQKLQQERSLRGDDQQLLEMRTRELRDVQTYLTTVDTLPVQEIVSMVKALNSDIFQIAAVISESTSFAKRFQLPHEVIKYAEDRLGHDITHLLYKAQERDTDHRSLVVQTVIQAVLADACLGITLSWDAGLKTTALRWAYDRIRVTSSQSVSARWRMLTRANTKYAEPIAVEKAAFSLVVHTLSVMLTIAGWTHGSTDWEAYTRAVAKTFGLDLERLVKDVVTLDRAMGEELMSMDVGLVTAATGEIFDGNTMENGFGGDAGWMDKHREGRSAETVACTSDLGLHARAVGREDGGGRPQVLLKPKVVLWSTLLDAPQTEVE
ncbi:hypothetical protein CPB85DRAFT_395936 [Mucidula mucida]|nr:hypothetical protein CPB85DRAFT_395936 [Mucidula mucida]